MSSTQRAQSASSRLECPVTFFDFQRLFPDEAACLRHIEALRWPNGFTCEQCLTSGEPFRFSARLKVLKCRFCHQDTSVTAGTVMHRSKTNTLIWFWSIFLVSTQTPGVSALELQKKLGIARYETAFQILHKLRAEMVRPGRDKIGEKWPIELEARLEAAFRVKRIKFQLLLQWRFAAKKCAIPSRKRSVNAELPVVSGCKN